MSLDKIKEFYVKWKGSRVGGAYRVRVEKERENKYESVEDSGVK